MMKSDSSKRRKIRLGFKKLIAVSAMITKERFLEILEKSKPEDKKLLLRFFLL